MEENAVVNGNVHISHGVDALGMDGSQMSSSMVQSFTDWLICFSNVCLTVEGRLVVFCFPLCHCLHQTSPLTDLILYTRPSNEKLFSPR